MRIAAVLLLAVVLAAATTNASVSSTSSSSAAAASTTANAAGEARFSSSSSSGHGPSSPSTATLAPPTAAFFLQANVGISPTPLSDDFAQTRRILANLSGVAGADVVIDISSQWPNVNNTLIFTETTYNATFVVFTFTRDVAANASSRLVEALAGTVTHTAPPGAIGTTDALKAAGVVWIFGGKPAPVVKFRLGKVASGTTAKTIAVQFAYVFGVGEDNVWRFFTVPVDSAFTPTFDIFPLPQGVRSAAMPERAIVIAALAALTANQVANTLLTPPPYGSITWEVITVGPAPSLPPVVTIPPDTTPPPLTGYTLIAQFPAWFSTRAEDITATVAFALGIPAANCLVFNGVLAREGGMMAELRFNNESPDFCGGRLPVELSTYIFVTTGIASWQQLVWGTWAQSTPWLYPGGVLSLMFGVSSPWYYTPASSGYQQGLLALGVTWDQVMSGGTDNTPTFAMVASECDHAASAARARLAVASLEVIGSPSSLGTLVAADKGPVDAVAPPPTLLGNGMTSLTYGSPFALNVDYNISLGGQYTLGTMTLSSAINPPDPYLITFGQDNPTCDGGSDYQQYFSPGECLFSNGIGEYDDYYVIATCVGQAVNVTVYSDPDCATTPITSVVALPNVCAVIRTEDSTTYATMSCGNAAEQPFNGFVQFPGNSVAVAASCDFDNWGACAVTNYESLCPLLYIVATSSYFENHYALPALLLPGKSYETVSLQMYGEPSGTIAPALPHDVDRLCAVLHATASGCNDDSQCSYVFFGYMSNGARSGVCGARCNNLPLHECATLPHCAVTPTGLCRQPCEFRDRGDCSLDGTDLQCEVFVSQINSNAEPLCSPACSSLSNATCLERNTTCVLYNNTCHRRCEYLFPSDDGEQGPMQCASHPSLCTEYGGECQMSCHVRSELNLTCNRAANNDNYAGVHICDEFKNGTCAPACEVRSQSDCTASSDVCSYNFVNGAGDCMLRCDQRVQSECGNADGSSTAPPTCVWTVEGHCIDDCSRLVDPDDCTALGVCQWSSALDQCYLRCDLRLVTQCGAPGAGVCVAVNNGSCVPACNQIDDYAACIAQGDLCDWDTYNYQCFERCSERLVTPWSYCEASYCTVTRNPVTNNATCTVGCPDGIGNCFAMYCQQSSDGTCSRYCDARTVENCTSPDEGMCFIGFGQCMSTCATLSSYSCANAANCVWDNQYSVCYLPCYNRPLANCTDLDNRCTVNYGVCATSCEYLTDDCPDRCSYDSNNGVCYTPCNIRTGGYGGCVNSEGGYNHCIWNYDDSSCVSSCSFEQNCGSQSHCVFDSNNDYCFLACDKRAAFQQQCQGDNYNMCMQLGDMCVFNCASRNDCTAHSQCAYDNNLDQCFLRCNVRPLAVCEDGSEDRCIVSNDGLQCYENCQQYNQYTCDNSLPNCQWRDENCGFPCSYFTNETQCTDNEAYCTWSEGSQTCYEQCSELGQDSCSDTTSCLWDPWYSTCFLDCSLRTAATCTANSNWNHCVWSSDSYSCIPNCASYQSSLCSQVGVCSQNDDNQCFYACGNRQASNCVTADNNCMLIGGSCQQSCANSAYNDCIDDSFCEWDSNMQECYLPCSYRSPTYESSCMPSGYENSRCMIRGGECLTACQQFGTQYDCEDDQYCLWTLGGCAAVPCTGESAAECEDDADDYTCAWSPSLRRCSVMLEHPSQAPTCGLFSTEVGSPVDITLKLWPSGSAFVLNYSSCVIRGSYPTDQVYFTVTSSSPPDTCAIELLNTGLYVGFTSGGNALVAQQLPFAPAYYVAKIGDDNCGASSTSPTTSQTTHDIQLYGGIGSAVIFTIGLTIFIAHRQASAAAAPPGGAAAAGGAAAGGAGLPAGALGGAAALGAPLLGGGGPGSSNPQEHGEMLPDGVEPVRVTQVPIVSSDDGGHFIAYDAATESWMVRIAQPQQPPVAPPPAVAPLGAPPADPPPAPTAVVGQLDRLNTVDWTTGRVTFDEVVLSPCKGFLFVAGTHRPRPPPRPQRRVTSTRTVPDVDEDPSYQPPAVAASINHDADGGDGGERGGAVVTTARGTRRVAADVDRSDQLGSARSMSTRAGGDEPSMQQQEGMPAPPLPPHQRSSSPSPARVVDRTAPSPAGHGAGVDGPRRLTEEEPDVRVTRDTNDDEAATSDAGAKDDAAANGTGDDAMEVSSARPDGENSDDSRRQSPRPVEEAGTADDEPRTSAHEEQNEDNGDDAADESSPLIPAQRSAGGDADGNHHAAAAAAHTPRDADAADDQQRRHEQEEEEEEYVAINMLATPFALVFDCREGIMRMRVPSLAASSSGAAPLVSGQPAPRGLGRVLVDFDPVHLNPALIAVRWVESAIPALRAAVERERSLDRALWAYGDLQGRVQGLVDDARKRDDARRIQELNRLMRDDALLADSSSGGVSPVTTTPTAPDAADGIAPGAAATAPLRAVPHDVEQAAAERDMAAAAYVRRCETAASERTQSRAAEDAALSMFGPVLEQLRRIATFAGIPPTPSAGTDENAARLAVNEVMAAARDWSRRVKLAADHEPTGFSEDDVEEEAYGTAPMNEPDFSELCEWASTDSFVVDDVPEPWTWAHVAEFPSRQLRDAVAASIHVLVAARASLAAADETISRHMAQDRTFGILRRAPETTANVRKLEAEFIAIERESESASTDVDVLVGQLRRNPYDRAKRLRLRALRLQLNAIRARRVIIESKYAAILRVAPEVALRVYCPKTDFEVDSINVYPHRIMAAATNSARHRIFEAASGEVPESSPQYYDLVVKEYVLGSAAGARDAAGNVADAHDIAEAAARQRRFAREIDTLRRVQHPRVVAIKRVFFSPDSAEAYVVMPRYRMTLLDFLNSTGAEHELTAEWLRAAIREAIRAVQILHDAGVVHCDVKPANFLLDGQHMPVLSDFDFAVSVIDGAGGQATVSSVEALGGTEGFVAPEVRRDARAVTAKADMFSLGRTIVTVVELIQRRLGPGALIEHGQEQEYPTADGPNGFDDEPVMPSPGPSPENASPAPGMASAPQDASPSSALPGRVDAPVPAAAEADEARPQQEDTSASTGTASVGSSSPPSGTPRAATEASYEHAPSVADDEQHDTTTARSESEEEDAAPAAADEEEKSTTDAPAAGDAAANDNEAAASLDGDSTPARPPEEDDVVPTTDADVVSPQPQRPSSVNGDGAAVVATTQPSSSPSVSRLPPTLADLVRQLTADDPATRPTAQEALMHPYLTVDVVARERRWEEERRQRLAEVAEARSLQQRLQHLQTPWYWTQREGLGDSVEVHDVTDIMNRRFQYLVDRTCNAGTLGYGRDQVTKMQYGKLEVTRVRRIENLPLWRRYCERRREIATKKVCVAFPMQGVATMRDVEWTRRAGVEEEAGELLLWHGTKPHLVDAICRSGFEERLAGLRGLFGAGNYFAEKSSKSDQYCTPDPPEDPINGTYTLMLCRVALGGAFFSSEAMSETRIPPPVDANRPENGRYDSIVGHVAAVKYREFVVYDRAQCYPEFIVEYKRRPKDALPPS